MLSKYRILHSGELVTEANSFESAIKLGKKLIDSINEFSNIQDEYTLVQIHEYKLSHKLSNFFSKLFMSKKNKLFFIPKYNIYVWSKQENKFVRPK